VSEGLSLRSARIAQVVWLVLAGATTAAYAVPVAVQWAALQTICRPVSACLSFQLDAASARTLSQHGISMGAFAVFTAAAYAVLWVIWYAPAALIIWRKPQDRGALVCAFFLVSFPALVAAWGGFIPASAPGILQLPLNVVPFAALLLFGLLFPDGRFIPLWTRWLVALLALAFAGLALFPNSAIWVIPVLVLPLSIVGVQIYRFRRVSTWAQRQQTKWVLFGLVVGILGLDALIQLGNFAVAQTANGSLYGGFSGILGFGEISVIPITIGIAVLRSRLWDIDRIINRALVYLSLTVCLGGLYIGSVIGLQAILRAVTGQQSGVAVAVSTLVIATLFNPLRHRFQDLIARIFYRRKYNAAQVLGAFGDRLRDEVDMAQLSRDLTSVVSDTLQPAHVSLWIVDVAGSDGR